MGGEMKQLQRFISILVPSNAYQKHMEGDDQHLPYLGQLSVLGLEEHEQFLVDSEDLTSCFNLFRLPRRWARYFCFSKKVDGKVFGQLRGAGLCGPDRGPNGLDQFRRCDPMRCETSGVWAQWSS